MALRWQHQGRASAVSADKARSRKGLVGRPRTAGGCGGYVSPRDRPKSPPAAAAGPWRARFWPGTKYETAGLPADYPILSMHAHCKGSIAPALGTACSATIEETEMPLRIGFVLFPRLTQLDLTGPYEILSRMRDAETLLVAKTLDPVRADRGLSIVPTATFADCPPLDFVCVPGGIGVNDVIGDAEILDFLRKTAAHARYVTSVCTGTLALGAAGLLRGRRAACHWLSREALRKFGAEPTDERVTVDGNIVTGGGVTAGID